MCFSNGYSQIGAMIGSILFVYLMDYGVVGFVFTLNLIVFLSLFSVFYPGRFLLSQKGHFLAALVLR